MTNKSTYEATRKIRDDVAHFLDSCLKKEVYVVLPENISKTFLLHNKPPGIDETKWLSGCYHIIHTIIELSFDKKYIRGKPGLYVPLYSVILKSICGNFYKSIFITKLIALNIIECDGRYSTNRHESFGFRLTKKYRDQPLKKRTINDPGIMRSIVNHRRRKLVDLKKRIRPIAHVARWSIDEKLQIDKPQALEYLDFYRSKMLKEIQKKHLKPQYRNKEESFVNTRYNKARYQVINWGNAPTITVDEAGGRLYTPVTALMSPLRHFLTYDGQELVSHDLRNSQPLHFLLMLEPGFWKAGKPGWTLERLNQGLFSYFLKEGTTPSVMWKNIAETLADKASDFPNFRFLIEQGKLYEFISKRLFDKFLHTQDALRFTTRNKTKAEVLKLMYYNPKERYSASHAPFKEFAKLFPLEADIMNFLKTRDYKDFSILLQKIEARILLHEVCKEVYTISGDIPLFTVHDSIITTKEYAPVLKEALVKKYTGLFGFTPQLTIEPLNAQKAELERMKYVKGKIDQADMEMEAESNKHPLSILFPFLVCENWDIEMILRKLIKSKFSDIGHLPRVPCIRLPEAK